MSHNAFVAKIVNTRLTKGFMAIFAPAESPPSPATLIYDDMRCCAIMCDDMRWRLWPSHLKILAKKANSKARRRTEDHQGGGKVCAQQIIGGDALCEQL